MENMKYELSENGEVLIDGEYRLWNEKEISEIEKELNSQDIHYWLSQKIELNYNKKYILWINEEYTSQESIWRFGFRGED